ncbi:hypothetical protein JAAARDRAFT_38712 [Jaapia argillacea MUCL 33604]|uniref:Uncharacterized protein n=1 Tax=Jaapia argillacea MUCL 33604 TaxID=933084 RepID=A0A067PUS4_9AGAM|nr:hypothetical protein JAAARDRAFT_38712 [Jaapia argillacea MUCL 33604]
MGAWGTSKLRPFPWYLRCQFDRCDEGKKNLKPLEADAVIQSRGLGANHYSPRSVSRLFKNAQRISSLGSAVHAVHSRTRQLIMQEYKVSDYLGGADLSPPHIKHGELEPCLGFWSAKSHRAQCQSFRLKVGAELCCQETAWKRPETGWR